MSPAASTRTLAAAAVVAALIAAAFFSGGRSVALPRVSAGDEPHYLLMITSLLADGDLDLGNNYRNAALGRGDAGAAFAGVPLDHQTTWFDGDRRVDWCGLHDCVHLARWTRGAGGDWRPPFGPGAPEFVTIGTERSIHPPGLAWFRAAFLWPLAGSRYLEPAAVLLSTLAAAAAFLVYLRLAELVAPNRAAALGAAALAFLGTPVWHYGRMLFSDIDLTLFAILAYAAALVWRRPLWAGLCLGLGTVVKPPFLLLALPLLVQALARRRWRELAALCAPCGAGAAAILLYNHLQFGSPWRPPQPFLLGNPGEGIAGLAVDPHHGILWTAPALAVALLGWPRFLSERRAEARVIGAAVVLYVALMATYRGWHGAACYGPRLILPVLPFAMMGAAFYQPRTRLARCAVLTVALLSIGINLAAATVLVRAAPAGNLFLVAPALAATGRL